MTELYRGKIDFNLKTPDGDVPYGTYKIEARRWVEDGAYCLSGKFHDRNCGDPYRYDIKIENKNGLLYGTYSSYGSIVVEGKDFAITDLKFGNKMVVEGLWSEDDYTYKFRLKADLISTEE